MSIPEHQDRAARSSITCLLGLAWLCLAVELHQSLDSLLVHQKTAQYNTESIFGAKQQPPSVDGGCCFVGLAI
jgi:hypothetical protein